MLESERVGNIIRWPYVKYFDDQVYVLIDSSNVKTIYNVNNKIILNRSHDYKVITLLVTLLFYFELVYLKKKSLYYYVFFLSRLIQNRTRARKYKLLIKHKLLPDENILEWSYYNWLCFEYFNLIRTCWVNWVLIYGVVVCAVLP